MKKHLKSSLLICTYILVALVLHARIIDPLLGSIVNSKDHLANKISIQKIYNSQKQYRNKLNHKEIGENTENVLQKLIEVNQRDKSVAIVTPFYQSYELTPYRFNRNDTRKKDLVELTVKSNVSKFEKIEKTKKINSQKIEEFKLAKDEFEIKEKSSDFKITLNTRDIVQVQRFESGLDAKKVVRASSHLSNFNVTQRLAKIRSDADEYKKLIAKEETTKETDILKEDEILVFDYVETRQASRETFDKPELEEKIEKVNDEDFIVYDYSARSETVETANVVESEPRPSEKIVSSQLSHYDVEHMGQLTNVAVSHNVRSTIDRFINGQNGQATTVNNVNDTIARKAQSSNANDPLSEQGKEILNSLSDSDYSSVIASALKEDEQINESANGHLTIRPLEVKLGHGAEVQGQRIENYELTFEYDKNKYLYDKNGEVKVSYQLNNREGVFRGTILKNGYMRTISDFFIEEGSFVQPVPVLDQYEFNSFLDARNLRGHGGHVILEIDETIEFVDLDVDFEQKIYLNEKFVETSESENHRYILIVGVEPGNVLLSYETRDNQVADHIVHIVEDEVLFTIASLLQHGRDQIELYERNIMSRSPQKLNLSEDRIRYFNRSSNSQVVALNRYAVSRPIRPLGMRRFYEVNAFGPSLMVGIHNNKKIELPGQSFVNQILDEFYIDELRAQCIVHFNYSKEVERVEISGETIAGPMYIESRHLDRDGVFSRSASELTTNSFYMGDDQGLISVRIQYTDETEDLIQTYCSPGTYLVEQL